MFKWFSKKVTYLPVESQQELEAVKLYYVRWYGRRGIFSSDYFPCMEAFPSKDSADKFATSLIAAFKLLKISGQHTQVTVSES